MNKKAYLIREIGFFICTAQKLKKENLGLVVSFEMLTFAI